jgi:hypothetical protein
LLDRYDQTGDRDDLYGAIAWKASGRVDMGGMLPGSGISFNDRGQQSLKGVPERHHKRAASCYANALDEPVMNQILDMNARFAWTRNGAVRRAEVCAMRIPGVDEMRSRPPAPARSIRSGARVAPGRW